MAAPQTLSESEILLLGALLRRKVRFMVVGLGAAAMQGAPVVTQDVDLWFEDLSDPRISKALQEVGAAYVPPFEMRPPMLAGEGAELFDIVLRMDGLKTFAEESKNCVSLPLGPHKLNVLKLDRILARKLVADRPKDRLAVPVLRDALATQGLAKTRAKSPAKGRRPKGSRK